MIFIIWSVESVRLGYSFYPCIYKKIFVYTALKDISIGETRPLTQQKMSQFSTLQITEILPNPEGKDGTAEFIELTNFSDATIDLMNYTLDDSENGSKSYKIQTQITPSQSITFYKSETKISLNNTNDEARLFSPNGELIDKIAYTKTTEGKSLSKIKILSEKGEKSATLWTTPSPNEPPETFYKFKGYVSEISAETGTSSLIFLPENSQKTISITSKDPLPQILKSIIQQNPETNLSLLTKKISNTEFELIDYKILNAQPAQTQTQSTQQNSATATTTTTNSDKSESVIFSPTIVIPALFILLVFTLLAFHLLKKKHKANTMAP